RAYPRTPGAPHPDRVAALERAVRDGRPARVGGPGDKQERRRRPLMTEERRRKGPVVTRNTSGKTEDLELLDRTELVEGEEAWRSLRIMSEFVEGFDALRTIPRAISVFGSARIGVDDPMYEAARALGVAAARAGLAVITGGG